MKKLILLLALSLLVGFTKPHLIKTCKITHTQNICQIFQTNPTWYWHAKQTERKWGVPVAIQMAIINQESHFDGEAKAPTSSAYGFPQALRKTWARYQRSTGTKARRNEFAAATDFIGWYVHMTHRHLGISFKNAYALYLVYHDGEGGYRSHHYSRHSFVNRLAKNVHKKADLYQSQLLACQNQIESLG